MTDDNKEPLKAVELNGTHKQDKDATVLTHAAPTSPLLEQTTRDVEQDEELDGKCCSCKYSEALKILLPCRSRKAEQNKLPSSRASLFRFISIAWITKLMWKAYWKGLCTDDLWDLQDEDRAAGCSRRLERLWKDEQKMAQTQNRDPFFHKAAFRSVRTRICVTVAISFITNVMQFLGPSVLLKMTLDYVNDPEIDHTYGTIIVILILLCYVSRCCFFNLSVILGTHTAARLNGAIQGVIYKKLIRLKNGGDILSAQITNIVTNDLERVTEAVVSACFLTAAPVLFILSLIYSIYVIGLWALLGLAVYFLFFPIMAAIGRMQSRLRLKTVIKTDKRISMMTEILNSLRLIKMYAWEEAFSTRIHDIRREEMKKLIIGALLQSVSSTAVPCVSVLSIMATVLGVTLTGHEMTATQIFTVASIFTSMQFTIGVLPFTIRSFVEGKVALSRIQKFLELPEHSRVDFSVITNNLSLSIKNANFNWEAQSIDNSKEPPKKKEKKNKKKVKSDKNGSVQETMELNNERDRVSDTPKETSDTLSGINLTIEKGKLIGVCGSIGSGKSSFISAICGDMKLQTGELQVNGRLALVTQQPWIFNDTVRENILVGKTFNKKHFEETMSVCALVSDLEMLPTADQTEIGERGVNLSGGQKQRVNLARAVYSDRDIYLLDDPLSAVDTKVAKHIFNKCILEHLSSKTVLLVTHAVHFLEKCDEIIYMKDGRICERGDHKTLVERKGEYFTLLGYDSAENKQDDRESSPLKEHESLHKENGEANGQASGQLIAEETKEIGGISKEVYKKFLELCGGGCMISLIFVVVCLFSLARIFSIVWIQIWLDYGDGKEEIRIAQNLTLPDDQMKGYVTDNDNLWIYQLIYASSLLIIFISGISKGVAVASRILAGASRLHHDLFQSIMRAPMSFMDVTPVGRILNRFSKDMDELDVRIPFFLDFVLQGLMTILSQAILVCVMYPIFIAPLLVVAVFFVLIDIFLNSGVRELKRLENLTKSPILQQIGSAASGLSIIRTFGTENTFIDRFFVNVDKHTATNLVFRLSSRWFTFRMDIMATCIIGAITIICVYTKGYTSTAVAGLALTSINSICGFIPFLMRMKSELQSRFTSVERLMEYAYHVESEAPMKIKDTEPPSSWPSKGEIVYDDVSLRYRPELPCVLNNLSFTIKSSEKIGVVGRTGAGKSSLLTSLLRIVEVESGKISIDGINIKSLGLQKLRSSISVIPQDPVLFQGTVRYNLDPFDECDDEAIWLSLERSHLKKTIQALPNKLFSEVKASGDNFSVGEKQLICLTRALLRHTKILVLDEATASVDIETDHLIQQTIQDAFPDCTVLTIAHRLNTVSTYDRILVLDRGQIKEFDAPKVLMANPDSLFHEMMKAMGIFSPKQMEAMRSS